MISDELLKEIDRGREGLNQGTTTGLDKLDDLTGGNLPNNFIVILAQSGVGKSSLMLYSYFYKALRTHENDDNYFCYLFYQTLFLQKNIHQANSLSRNYFEIKLDNE